MAVTTIGALILVIVGATIQLLAGRWPRTRTRALGLYLVWWLAVSGFLTFAAGLDHIFNGPSVAASIGWASGSPFQFEVGVADVALGTLGILCIWLRGRFWSATVIATAVFGFGVAAGHVREIVVAHDFASGNAGVPLYLDVIGPIISIALLTAYRVSLRSFAEGSLEKAEPGESQAAPPRGMGHPAT